LEQVGGLTARSQKEYALACRMVILAKPVSHDKTELQVHLLTSE
jgi:hypothetical protein